MENGFDHQSELPEGFGWDDMREGIYEKMQTTKPKKNNRRWYWLLLLFLIVGGAGIWFVLENLNEERTITDSVEINQKNEKEIPPLSENIESKVNSLQGTKNNSTEDILPLQSYQKHEKIVPKKVKSVSQTSTNTNQSDTKLPKATVVTPTSRESKQSKENKQQKTIITSSDVNSIRPSKDKTTKNTASKPVAVLSEIPTDASKLPAISPRLIESKSSDLTLPKTTKHIETSAFTKHVSIGVAGGVMNWAAFDATNINHEFVNGFPGYRINPSISLSLTPRHNIQMDYEYIALEELFDYGGSHEILVTREDEVVREVVSGLTGNLLYVVREDVAISGTRYQRELKYNQYKFHTMSLGYRFEHITTQKSSFGFYAGGSYLFKQHSKGKRLNEQLNVIAFNNDNPLFQQNQLGLRLGIHYNYQLNPNIKLFSQVITTKYITNWELDNSDSSTRPLLYGLQIGVRYRLTNN